MTEDQRLGTYADGRTYRLGDTWRPLDARVRDVAVDRMLQDLQAPGMVDRAAAYYDPAGNFAGALVTTLEPNPVDEIVAADILAVAALSVRPEPLQVRRLTDPHSAARRAVGRHLRAIPLGLPITSLDDGDPQVRSALDHMWGLYNELKLLTSERTAGTNRWVFASKLCARKRPDLFPVRDNLVCAHLSETGRLTGEGMGNFSNDLQVFAYAMSVPQVRDHLVRLRSELTERQLTLDAADLRLLDVVLWTAAGAAASGQASSSAGSGAT